MENDDRASVRSVEPVVRTAGAAAGDVVQASLLSLPAATATATPDCTSAVTALSTSAERLTVPSERFATDWGSAFWATQSMPAMMAAPLPEPWQLSTRTAWTVAFLAMPHVVPAAVLVTWVP